LEDIVDKYNGIIIKTFEFIDIKKNIYNISLLNALQFLVNFTTLDNNFSIEVIIFFNFLEIIIIRTAW